MRPTFMARACKPVALISMPTLSARFPSFQLALLKPLLEREGIEAQAFSLFMYFGTHIGWKLNETLADVWPSMVGEWIWGKTAFGDEAPQGEDEYFREFASNFHNICRQAGCSIEDLKLLRERAAPAFIDFCLDSVDWSRFGLIGFSVVFQQLLSSVSLTRRLKERYPAIPIIFGGAGFEDDIADEIIRRCPQVDYVHCGDAELSFPEAVRRLNRHESMEGLRGVMWRKNGDVVYAGRAANLQDMDSTPVPDFDEYFYARTEGKYEFYDQSSEVLLPIETARGCWWGMKNHCTFCGLNRAGMEFRAKSPGNVVEELESLSSRYGAFHFNAIDNIIAPEYVEDLFGRLARANTDIRLHYEIRPNLTHSQLREMKRGGLFSVQPGVESLSTHLLKLMKKHTTGMRNLELIKWCTYYRINNLYNILMRFPGETPEDYRVQRDVIAKIPHFQPPYAIVKARADRGSSMFTDPESQSIVRMRPAACYEYIFPKDKFDLNRVSYYFDHEMESTVGEQEYEAITDLVYQWKGMWEGPSRPYLNYRKSPSTIAIEDGRGREPILLVYSGRAAELYEHCNDSRSERDIGERFGGEQWVDDALNEFLSRDLMIHLDGRYLSLALPANPYC
ncbi:MAG TPA: RiPP maturation radical SAM C-methyltransferase [Blastocatellia bacterium]|nr:RiPP maturation radical SAM C-methyltransferase [Blastocatellia bacterium]